MALRHREPKRLVETPRAVVPNEVILTTVEEARNDDLPHYLNVAAGTAPPATSFDEVAIDGVIQRMGLRTRSVARVFVPRREAESEVAASEPPLRASISTNYEEDEDHVGLSRTYRILFETETSVEHVCSALCESRAIEEAHPNYIAETYAVPDDPFYGQQWGLHAIEAENGWEIEQGHPDVRIAVVDTGVDLRHDDLRGKLAYGFDFVDYRGIGGRYLLLGDYRGRDDQPGDEDGHGTHVAGILGALSNNGLGVAGVCWGGKILPVRALFRVYDTVRNRESSVGTSVDIDAAIKYAVDAGAHVINLSLGGPNPAHGRVIRYAYDRGVCVIAAAGNASTRNARYPAADPRTLAVGAVGTSLRRARYSNYGPAYGRFVMAPGSNIASTFRGNGYVSMSGTSMASPFVTGLAGLVVSVGLRHGVRLTPEGVYEIIRQSATPLGAGKGDMFHGEGLINVRAALELAQQRVSK